MHAVLTCDIVNSTLLGRQLEKKLITALGKLLSPHKHEFYRGDSFQVYMKDGKEALRTALLCRSMAIAIDTLANEPLSDIRISIGLGAVEQPVRTLATAKGEAFLLSGRTFDLLQKTEARLVIASSGQGAAGIAFRLIADHVNSIFQQMTPKQAEVIFELLKGGSQQEASAILRKSKSTISQHVTAARWNEIESLLESYTKLVELISL